MAVAATVFRERGLGGAGLREVMKRAGLTQGAFYFHFRNKDELFQEAALHALPSSSLLEPGTNIAPKKQLRIFIESYLSAEHRDHPDSGCILAALGGELARGTRQQRQDFVRVAARMVDMLAPLIPGRDPTVRRQQAALLLASMAGVLTASRILGAGRQSDALLAAARKSFVTRF